VPDNYFVRLDAAPGPAPAPPSAPRRGRRPEPVSYDPGPESRRSHRHRRRVSGRRVFLVLLAIGLVVWFAWATKQPGGVSGTINGFIEHVRGEVQDASAAPDMHNASKHYNDLYAQTGNYPVLSEDQMTAAGIGIDIDVAYCTPDAIVLRTLTVSRLLVGGHDLGEQPGHLDCPRDLSDPAPWKVK